MSSPGPLNTYPATAQWIDFAPDRKVIVKTGRVELGQGIAAALIRLLDDAGAREGVGEVYGECGFTHTALLAGDGDADHAENEKNCWRRLSEGRRSGSLFFFTWQARGFCGCFAEAT